METDNTHNSKSEPVFTLRLLVQLVIWLAGFGSTIYGGVHAYDGIIAEIKASAIQYQYLEKDVADIHAQLGRVDVPALAKQVEINTTQIQKHDAYLNYLTGKPVSRPHDSYALLR